MLSKFLLSIYKIILRFTVIFCIFSMVHIFKLKTFWGSIRILKCISPLFQCFIVLML